MSDRGPVKPSHAEAEFFALEEVEKRRKLAHQVNKQLAREEMQRLRDLHHMHCPKCGLKMTEMKVRGLEVDVCFNCNGVFLDQGDIDAIAAAQQKGIMSAILNWFKEETHHQVK